MIIDVECDFCRGLGKVMRNGPPYGDPNDPGKKCPECDGAGVVSHDLNDDVDDDNGEWEG